MDYNNLPKLDRLVEFDERSRLYPATAGLTTNLYRSYTWSCNAYLDQGSEGACVGFAWTHELAARPKIILRNEQFALAIYHRAQELDYWPGEDYSGTSVLAGIKAVQEILNTQGLPLIREYRWAFGIQDVCKIVGYRGPVVLGINWYNDMYYPDVKYFITPTGELVGGHAILANGIKIVRKDTLLQPTWDNIDQDKSFVKLHNSWGLNYGNGGNAYITVRDLDVLLRQDGEACIPQQRSFA